jgi:hypothetical protein
MPYLASREGAAKPVQHLYRQEVILTLVSIAVNASTAACTPIRHMLNMAVLIHSFTSSTWPTRLAALLREPKKA